MIDSCKSMESKRLQLSVIKAFINAIFAGRHSINRFKWLETSDDAANSVDKLNWNYFEERLTKHELAIFRAFSRIACYLPHEPFYDLLADWTEWDVEEMIVRNEDDLIAFGSKAYGCISDVMIFTYCRKRNVWPDNFGPATEHMLENIRRLTVVNTCHTPFIFAKFRY